MIIHDILLKKAKIWNKSEQAEAFWMTFGRAENLPISGSVQVGKQIIQ